MEHTFISLGDLGHLRGSALFTLSAIIRCYGALMVGLIGRDIVIMVTSELAWPLLLTISRDVAPIEIQETPVHTIDFAA